MTDAGCTTVVGPPPAGAVWVFAPPARAQRFDCVGLSADSAQGLARSYRQLLAAEATGTNAYANFGEWEVTTESTFSCSGTETTIVTAGALGSGRTVWVDAYLPDGGYYWSFYVTPGIPTTFILPTGCGWVETVTATKFGVSGLPELPEPGEYPNPGGSGGGSFYPDNANALDSVSIEPSVQYVNVADFAYFKARLWYQSGAEVLTTDLIWESLDTTRVKPDDKGTFQGIATGPATVTARIGSLTATGSVMVSPSTAPLESEEIDYLEDVADPNCLLVQSLPAWMAWRNRSYQKAWCRGAIPDTNELPKIQAAVTRIRGKGGPCTAIADSLSRMLSNNKLRLYDRAAGENWGGVGVRNGSNVSDAWMILERKWVTDHATAADATVVSDLEPYRRTLQTSLVHEMQHVLGISHSDGERTAPGEGGFLTPLMNTCGDVE